MLLTLAIFLPLLTALVALVIPGQNKNAVRTVCLLGSVLTFAVVVSITAGYHDKTQESQDPKNADSTNLMAVFGRKLEGGIQSAIPAPTGSSDLSVEQARWLAADETYDTHASSLARAHVAADTWNRLRLRERLRARLAERKDFDTADLASQASVLFRGSPAADRPSVDRETYDQLLELSVASSTPLAPHVRFVEHGPWIESFRINYFLGVDGLSIPLIFLTALLTIICLIYSWYVDKAAKGFYILFLIMETGLIGVFCALDFFLFYVFWEIVLLPMYFLIGVWGGPRRIYASIKFFIYTLVGSVLMLIAMLVLYNTSELPLRTFNMMALTELAPGLTFGLQWWLFGALFIGFAIKVPVFPFHTWLPDAHVEAPTAGSMMLAGVLLKMGGYGFFRVAYPMLPDAAMSEGYIWFVGTLGVINMVYGALAAMAQKDFKALVAYSSISHMGYILIGLAAGTVGGYAGGILQMFNHGISSAMMFCLVGCIQNRLHHRDLGDMGGLGLQMPYFTGLATIGFFAALGLPGLNGFISEAITFLGCFESDAKIHRVLVYISLSAVVLTAGYILWTIQRVFLGTTPDKFKGHPDVNPREALSLIPLAALCIILGVFPAILIGYMDPSIHTLVEVVKSGVDGVASGVASVR